MNTPSYPHGGGTVRWTGNGNLPYGAFRYKGPCPPSPHQFTVEALGAGNQVLATAKAKRRFPN